MKLNFKYNRKAFTLVELLIVIAIIGILFVVLVSKVDFATDKAKTTGVQTDFRSFQVAFETVSRENAGFNTLGWDTGDKVDDTLIAGYTYENADKDGGDRVRNSYDKGDMNLNGICEDGETWVGQKIYTETWTGIYTLDNPADADDMSAYLALEKAINKNLDPALQISIDPENKTIYMANGYQDPWTTEYHGFYLSNAKVDGKDRGAIVMYSDGPNKVFGSEQTIANGIVSVTVKNGGINGQDDLSLITCYTYINGYGEIATTTEGFSNNQVLSGNGNSGVGTIAGPGEGGYTMLNAPIAPITTVSDVVFRSEAAFSTFRRVEINNQVVNPDNYTVTEGSTIVTFKQEYIETLANDTYNVEIISDNGSAKASMTIELCDHSAGFTNSFCNNCGGTIVPVKASLNDYAWRDLQILGKQNIDVTILNNTYHINVGDSKQSNDTYYKLVDLDGNNYGGFVFMFDTTLKDTSSGSGNSYHSTTLQEKVEKLYENLNDEELKAAVKASQVCCRYGNTYSYDELHFFLPSLSEIYSSAIISSRYSSEADRILSEGEIFDWFAQKFEDEMYTFAISSFLGIIEDWDCKGAWLRTTTTSNSGSPYFCIDPHGSVNEINANGSDVGRIPVVFVIGGGSYFDTPDESTCLLTFTTFYGPFAIRHIETGTVYTSDMGVEAGYGRELLIYTGEYEILSASLDEMVIFNEAGDCVQWYGWYQSGIPATFVIPDEAFRVDWMTH